MFWTTILLFTPAFLMTSTTAFDCYVGAQLGATRPSTYKADLCPIDTITNISNTQCFVEKFGGTVVKACKQGHLFKPEVPYCRH